MRRRAKDGMMKEEDFTVYLPSRLRRSRCRTRGFTLLELTIALFAFGMLIIVFGATFPVATRGSRVGANYAQAALLAQHKIDQMRQAKYTNLNGDGLYARGIVDSATPDASGAFLFTTIDTIADRTGVQGFFPSGSSGKITLSAVPAQGSFSVPSARALMVTVTISWAGGNQGTGSFSTHTVIAAS